MANILVKSISRFSRNIVDCQRYAELLRSNGVEIRFEKEGISTADPSSFVIFGLMSTIAQSESESISKNMQWAIAKRQKAGKYKLGKIYGYELDGRIDSEEAEVVRQMKWDEVTVELCERVDRVTVFPDEIRVTRMQP